MYKVFTTYGLQGSRIDCCEHEHESRDEAQKCLLSHQNQLRQAGKVSRRQIVEIESLDNLYDEAALY